MSRVVHWLQHHETQLFRLVNHKSRHAALDYAFVRLTHLGGATATIIVTLAIALFASGDWRLAAWQSAAALAASHLPVAFIKKKYPRLRPYMVLPDTNICRNPLSDHSFPSGHSTAIFAVVMPFVLLFPPLGFLLVPLACLVALSRVYLGLHYPSDCAAGAAIGSAAAMFASMLIG
ncbi:phosphatase PAP2 family protein [Paenibacillus sp. MBLB4367]|uniref:phosphatase PAP2 family protein n=1 Tax=Paenibacillus sp. MBLB4367 TaxID=3384767 RepID=UPI00390843D5